MKINTVQIVPSLGSFIVFYEGDSPSLKCWTVLQPRPFFCDEFSILILKKSLTVHEERTLKFDSLLKKVDNPYHEDNDVNDSGCHDDTMNA